MRVVEAFELNKRDAAIVQGEVVLRAALERQVDLPDRLRMVAALVEYDTEQMQ